MTKYPARSSRAGDDVARAKQADAPDGVVAPLTWVSLVLVSVMAFVWWLLVGPPITS